MNNPQKIAHGRFLTKANFPRFVETFNWLVDFCTNLRGDADAPNDFGKIRLDRKNDARPVIRLDWQNFGGGMPSPASSDVGLFRLGTKEPEPGEEPSDNLWLFNTYIRLGGSWIAMNGETEWDTGTSAESFAGQFLFLYSSSMSTHGPDFSVSMTSSFADIEQYSCDPTTIVIPLYHFDENGAVDMDFRIGVGTDAFDLLPIESTQEEQT